MLARHRFRALGDRLGCVPSRRTREQALAALVDALDAQAAHHIAGTTPPAPLLERISRLRAEVAR